MNNVWLQELFSVTGIKISFYDLNTISCLIIIL